MKNPTSLSARGVTLVAVQRRQAGSLSCGPSARAFTLVEMLVVIAIIATLAGILLPVLGRAKTKAREAHANTDLRSFGAAITAYQSQYGLYPCSDPDAKAGADKTYTNTSDMVTILMDLDRGPNANHLRNPQKQVFLNAKMTDRTTVGGINQNDLIFRDPWGTPYVVTLDLDYDNTCNDAWHGAVHAPVAVWSFGVDRKPGTKDDLKSW